MYSDDAHDALWPLFIVTAVYSLDKTHSVTVEITGIVVIVDRCAMITIYCPVITIYESL